VVALFFILVEVAFLVPNQLFEYLLGGGVGVGSASLRGGRRVTTDRSRSSGCFLVDAAHPLR
jgi:hypothetical protein